MPKHLSSLRSVAQTKYTQEAVGKGLRIGELFGLPQNPTLQWAIVWILMNAAFAGMCYCTIKLWTQDHYILATLFLLVPIYIPFIRSIAVTVIRSKRQLGTSLWGFLWMTLQSFSFIYIAALCFLTLFHFSTAVNFFRGFSWSSDYPNSRNLTLLFYDIGFYSTVICITLTMARVAYFRWIRDTTIPYPNRKETAFCEISLPEEALEPPVETSKSEQPMEEFAGR